MYVCPEKTPPIHLHRNQRLNPPSRGVSIHSRGQIPRPSGSMLASISRRGLWVIYPAYHSRLLPLKAPLRQCRRVHTWRSWKTSSRCLKPNFQFVAKAGTST
ncbi:hypothetical protein M413DRAFT_134502 [Hebeloma cylindrosporum]|uniref:Uncharacterized protein n=1 Tax=Hebeloma cylindrosporum TaxID=76867 RepID=A0A0C3C0M9_HEBCY|nr:hypothetical protein M413DRAFT_134502 [Hebeloma cylindrosporum h7]